MAYGIDRGGTGLGESRSLPGLTHDIRAQLNIILGFTQLMLDEVPGKINEAQRRGLNDVLNSGKRLLELLT
jgi:signal transduction histidine kinase